jgi:probable phosphoglycerate mutase
MPPRSAQSGPSLFSQSTPPREDAHETPQTSDTPAETPAKPKPTGWINAHCDGGARGNPGPSGYGALIQAADGAVIAELSEYLGLRTNNFAEYSGLLGCLDFAVKNGYPRLRVVSDSELMVKQIQGKYQVKSPDLKPLYEEAKRRIAKLDGFEISHALRHKNKDADRLANDAMDRGTRKPGAAPAPQIHIAKPNAPVAPATRPVPDASRPPAPPIPIARPDRPTAQNSGPILESAVHQTQPAADSGTMLRGFTRDGVVHILGGARLPDGVFVKIIRE